MNEYTSLQKFLHRVSLSPKFVRKLSFDLEKYFFLKSDVLENCNHVFVTGLARSGTTIMLRALYDSSDFATLTYADMPFLLAPNIWGKLQRTANPQPLKERAHGDGILVNVESPEAFEEVYWMTQDEPEASAEFNNYIQLILRKYNKKRYLSKNNQNVRRLSSLLQLLPHSSFLIPFREPLQHANSLYTQHTRFLKAQSSDKFVKDYMDWIGHSEFGRGYKPYFEKEGQYDDPSNLNHWLEQWLFMYTKLADEFSEVERVRFVCYEDLCNDNSVWISILAALNLNTGHSFNFSESHKSIVIDYDKDIFDKASVIYEKMRRIQCSQLLIH